MRLSRFLLLCIFALLPYTLWAQSLTNLTVNPNIVYGGGTTTGTVTLSSAALEGGMNVAITSNTSVLEVPASVTVQSGNTSANFTINVKQVSAEANRIVSATMSGVTKSAIVTLRPGLKGLTITPSTVVGGESTTGTALLYGNATGSGTTVALTDNTSVVSEPASVLIPAGSASQTFPITTSAVSATTTRIVSGTLVGVTKNALITLNPAVKVEGLSFSPSTVDAGSNTTGSVTLTAPAPAGGAVITLSDNSSVLTTPANTTVNAGATFSQFTEGTTAVSSTVTRQVTATYNGSSKTANITLNPTAGLQSLTVNPTTVFGGQNTTGTVTLTSAAPSGGKLVALTDNSSVLTTPASVTVAQGATTANFTEGTTNVASTVTRQVSASLNGVTKTANVTINPGVNLNSVAVTPTTIRGGQYAAGTVTISTAAPAGGITVALSDNTAALNTPASVQISQGATTANFDVTANTVASSTPGTVTATFGGVSKTANVTVEPGSVVVNLEGEIFTPKTITVKPGTTIRWVYMFGQFHNVKTDVEGAPGPSSQTMGDAGDFYEWTVPANMALGTDIYYHCDFHAVPGDGTQFGTGMVGLIRVR